MKSADTCWFFVIILVFKTRFYWNVIRQRNPLRFFYLHPNRMGKTPTLNYDLILFYLRRCMKTLNSTNAYTNPREFFFFFFYNIKKQKKMPGKLNCALGWLRWIGLDFLIPFNATKFELPLPLMRAMHSQVWNGWVKHKIRGMLYN